MNRCTATKSLYSFENEMPLALESAAKSTFLLTDRALRACDSKGTVLTETEYQGTVVDFTVNENGALLVLESDAVTATNRLLAFNSDGELVLDGTHVGDVCAAALSKTSVFLLGNGCVTAILLEDQTAQTVEVEAQAKDILVTGDRALRVIYPAKAVYVNFEFLDK